MPTRKGPRPIEPDALRRERAGSYRSGDGRFMVEQASSGWIVLDGEALDGLGQPRARGPFPTLDAARTALVAARAEPSTGSARSTPEPTVVVALDAAGIPPERAGARPERTTQIRDRRGRAATPAPPPVMIRELRRADGDALRALWASVGFRLLGDDDRSLARLVRRNPGLVLVASEGTKVVGSALGAWDGRRGWIHHVATAPSHRGRGIARRMISQIEAQLVDLGCAKVNVLVRDGNADGTDFWRALGYEPTESRPYGKEFPAD